MSSWPVTGALSLTNWMAKDVIGDKDEGRKQISFRPIGGAVLVHDAATDI